ncbi:NUDIX hydrolase [Lacticaseibacillus daqingensis]|uniref:NUDIX hydrolase n=1 Tax=Lacticaseibacillus daqingensis TaxID=2486014 RepID=UPI000F79D1CF|nr:NUDIX domain-containing protein [Lacticaseibacillus daqingensis]
MTYVSDLRADIGHRPLILCGSCGVILNPRGEVLLQQRNELAKRWGLVGGLMELGETPAQVLVREAWEETGLQLDPATFTLLGVYGGDQLRTAPNGDLFYSVSVAYVVPSVTGTPIIADAETLALRWVALDRLPEPMVPRYRQVLADFVARGVG